MILIWTASFVAYAVVSAFWFVRLVPMLYQKHREIHASSQCMYHNYSSRCYHGTGEKLLARCRKEALWGAGGFALVWPVLAIAWMVSMVLKGLWLISIRPLTQLALRPVHRQELVERCEAELDEQ